jgi:CheY-like chemotaxis protein
MGNDAHAFYDGQSLLDAVSESAPDLVILDIGMPNMDGYALARRLRITNAARPLYVVALTGWGGPQDRLQSRAAGINEHLVKPVEPKALERVLESVRGRMVSRNA